MADTRAMEFDIDDCLGDEYDPLADSGLDDDDDVDFPIGQGENLKSDGSHAAPIPAHDPRPAQERIAELFSGMRPRRKTLMAILSHCAEAKPVLEVAEYIGVLKEHDHSVYTANDFCALLERAGAIERVGEDGTTYEEVELEPKTVVIDGVEYLEPATPPPAFWRTTPEGLAFAQEDEPAIRIQGIFEEEPAYLPIYKQILSMCAAEEGASARALAQAIDSDPLLKSPRYYSSRFVEKLNQAGALEWGDKVWRATEAGIMALDGLAGV